MAQLDKRKRENELLESVTFQQDKIISEYAQDYHDAVTNYRKAELLLQKNEDQLNEANIEIRRLRDELGEL